MHASPFTGDAGWMVFHGWVDDVTSNALTPDEHRVRVILAQGGCADFFLGRLDDPVGFGDEVSIVVERARPSRALILMNHTTGDSTNYLRRGPRPWPHAGVILLVSIVATVCGATSEWWAAPAIWGVATTFWLTSAWRKRVHRDRVAGYLDYLTDRAYRGWLGQRQKNGCRPS